ncbi:hypothetical protein HGG76_20105 [Ochrobactrum tritici]|uniref:Uncharacterized protein n=1 Tax=Brucella tritici TaxID=94626 RepID=A0A7X6JB84_9HYPH|nr:hypothetical protein [Brucella tritici]
MAAAQDVVLVPDGAGPGPDVVSALDAESGVVRDVDQVQGDALDAGLGPFSHVEHCRREDAVLMD